jgi:hypothetical protein
VPTKVTQQNMLTLNGMMICAKNQTNPTVAPPGNSSVMLEIFVVNFLREREFNEK